MNAPDAWVEKAARIIFRRTSGDVPDWHEITDHDRCAWRDDARAVLAAVLPDVWPCDNYKPPHTCLTAPCAKGSECDFCRAQVAAAQPTVDEPLSRAQREQPTACPAGDGRGDHESQVVDGHWRCLRCGKHPADCCADAQPTVARDALAEVLTEVRDWAQALADCEPNVMVQSNSIGRDLLTHIQRLNAILASGVVQDAADVRRAVAEEIYMAGEGHYGSPVVAAYEAARRIARVTQSKPSKPKSGTVLVKLTLRIPEAAFLPLRPEAVVVIPEDMAAASAPIQVEANDPTE